MDYRLGEPIQHQFTGGNVGIHGLYNTNEEELLESLVNPYTDGSKD
jgi:hypothetical protein